MKLYFYNYWLNHALHYGEVWAHSRHEVETHISAISAQVYGIDVFVK